jgi:hypothetical protein
MFGGIAELVPNGLNSSFTWKKTIFKDDVSKSTMFNYTAWGANGKILVADEEMKTFLTTGTSIDANKIEVIES